MLCMYIMSMGVSQQQKKQTFIIHDNLSSKLSRPTFAHQSTPADAGSVAPSGLVIAKQHDMTNGAQLIKRLNQRWFQGSSRCTKHIQLVTLNLGLILKRPHSQTGISLGLQR